MRIHLSSYQEDLRNQFDRLAVSLHEDTGNMLGYYAIEAAIHMDVNGWIL